MPSTLKSIVVASVVVASCFFASASVAESNANPEVADKFAKCAAAHTSRIFLAKAMGQDMQAKWEPVANKFYFAAVSMIGKDEAKEWFTRHYQGYLRGAKLISDAAPDARPALAASFLRVLNEDVDACSRLEEE